MTDLLYSFDTSAVINAKQHRGRDHRDTQPEQEHDRCLTYGVPHHATEAINC